MEHASTSNHSDAFIKKLILLFIPVFILGSGVYGYSEISKRKDINEKFNTAIHQLDFEEAKAQVDRHKNSWGETVEYQKLAKTLQDALLSKK